MPPPHDVTSPPGQAAGQAAPAMIRPMQERDRMAVERLLRELNLAGDAYTQDRNLAEDAGRKSLAESETWVDRYGGAVLVAEMDAHVVGTVIVADVSLDFNVRPALQERSYVLELVVAPAYRRRGMGRQLVDAALHHARERGHCALLLNAAAGNTAAMDLYLGAGFETYSFEMIRKLVPF